MGQAIPMLKDMATGEFAEMDKYPRRQAGAVRHAGKQCPPGHSVPDFQPGVFNEFNSNTAAVFNGEMSAQEYCASINDTVQQL